MNVKELRFGNWVLLDDKGQYQIDDWHDLEELDSFPVDHSYCRPLPLTEEWLLKFGFDKGSSVIANKLFFLDEFEVDEFVIYLEGDDLCYYDGSKMIIVSYVHQFQNLYHALTGKELAQN